MSARKPTRAERSARRREAFHTGRISTASTPTAAVWAACGWLVAEGRRQGGEHLTASGEAVAELARLSTAQIERAIARIRDLREETH